MRSADVEERLQAGIERLARLEGRTVAQVRQEAIRRYLADCGLALLDQLASSGPDPQLTDEAAQAVARREIDAARRARG